MAKASVSGTEICTYVAIIISLDNLKSFEPSTLQFTMVKKLMYIKYYFWEQQIRTPYNKL